MTNSILCLKLGGKPATVYPKWQKNCGERFSKPLIDIIEPKVVISLGERTHNAIMHLYGKKPRIFKAAVDDVEPVILTGDVKYFPMYHCSQQVINSKVRSEIDQRKDWHRATLA